MLAPEMADTTQGAGTLLGAAAGDAAAQSREFDRERSASPSLHTLRLTTYHLLHHGEVSPERLAEELRSISRHERHAHPVDLSLSAAAIPLGLWYRRDAAALVDVLSHLGALQTATPETLASALTVGGAVAAWTYGQRQLDVWRAAVETVGMHEHARGSELGQAMNDGWEKFDEEGHVSLLSTAPVRAVLHTAKLATHDDSGSADGTVRDAATSSSHFGFFVGAMLGARHGLRPWNWAIPDEDWYREAGRRLSIQQGETAGLVEPQHLS